MSTYLKLPQFFATNVKEHISSKHSYLGEYPPSLPEQVSQDLSLSQFSNAQDVEMSTENSSQKSFNLLTDTYSGIHEYE